MALSRPAKIWIVAGIVALILVGWIVSAYNSFVSLEEGVKTSWSNVESAYQRRFDLIPNLSEAVKANLKQEQDVFGLIADARTHYATGTTPEQKVAAANQLETGLSRLLVIVENYPQLSSSETIRGLMTQLEGTENRINVARDRYNETVNTYNIAIRSFPNNIFAGMFGFSQKTRFEAAPGAALAPKVNLQLTK